MSAWRYIADDGVTAAFGLAADEALAARQGGGASPPTVRLYTYASHCALVGRFQRAASEVRLAMGRRIREIAVGGRPLDPARRDRAAGWAAVGEADGPPVWGVVADHLRAVRRVRIDPRPRVKVVP